MKKIDNNKCAWLNRKRERKRLKRLRKFNGKNARYRRYKKRVTITIPPVLDLDEHREDLIELIGKIKNRLLLIGGFFILDHGKMMSITFDALLMLTAEIERCVTISKVPLKGNRKYFPKREYIKTLLIKIGYWDHFNIELSKGEMRDNSDLLFLKIISSNSASSEKIGGLVSFFEQLVKFDFSERDKFSDAMLEAACNTVEHAYEEKYVKNIKKWWLTASLDKSSHEISFVFYDQGSGVLRTLRSGGKGLKFKELITSRFDKKLSKGQLLKKLVTTDLSKYKSKRRGNGLISFKQFIDEAAQGELIIHTENVSYFAISDKIVDHAGFIDGTMIVWKIKAVYDSESTHIKIKGA